MTCPFLSQRDMAIPGICALPAQTPMRMGSRVPLNLVEKGPGRTGRNRWTDTRHNAFGPRLGIAYQIRPDTVIRAGGGIYYVPVREGANADTHNTGFAGYRNIFQP